jgi:hypothetical protein
MNITKEAAWSSCPAPAQQRPVQALAHHRHDERAHGAHGAAFGRRGHAQEDGAQHQEDQQQRRDQHEGHALGQLGQQAQVRDAVGDGDQPGEEAAAAHGDDDLLVGRHDSTSSPCHQVWMAAMFLPRSTATAVDSSASSASER